MSVRKAHNSGRNHLRNVVDYYQRASPSDSPPAATHPSLGPFMRCDKLTRPAEIGHEKAQSVIDSITSSYAAEGQAHANPMLPQNQPGQAFPPFPFPPGGAPPFSAPGGGPPGAFPPGAPPGMCPDLLFFLPFCQPSTRAFCGSG